MDRHETTALLKQHMPLVNKMVTVFMRRVPRSVLRDDLVSAGMMGLLHALRSKTHTSPEMLEAYARIRIRGAIIDELRRHDWSPRRKKAAPETGSVMPMTGRVRKVAACGIDVAVVGFDDLPANAPLAKNEPSPLENVTEKRSAEALHAAMAALPEREHAIVRMRYFEEVTSQSIATSMGLSEARISQLLSRATQRLRTQLEEQGQEIDLAA